MLRRKLLAGLGSLVLVLLVAAVASIVLLDRLLGDIARISEGDLQFVTTLAHARAAAGTIEAEYERHRVGAEVPIDALLNAVMELETEVRLIVGATGDGTDGTLPALPAEVRRVVRTMLAGEPATGAGDVFDRLRIALAVSSEEAFTRSRAEQAAVAERVRITVVVLGIGSLVVINVIILGLLRAAMMVLRPVASLMEASRHLAAGDYGHRVRIDTADEFAELASATNALAAELAAQEEARVEALRQMGRTLNHELNNAIAILEYQVRLLERTSSPDPGEAQRLRQMEATLERMARTVGALTRVRRIVLTDYLQGEKMLDLAASIEEEPSTAPTQPVPATPP